MCRKRTDQTQSQMADNLPLEDDQDYMTDDGIESEVLHDAEEIRCKHSKAWEVEARVDPFKTECGNAVCKAPAIRRQVLSCFTNRSGARPDLQASIPNVQTSNYSLTHCQSISFGRNSFVSRGSM